MSIYVLAVQWLRSCALASAQREETCGFNPARKEGKREGREGSGAEWWQLMMLYIANASWEVTERGLISRRTRKESRDDNVRAWGSWKRGLWKQQKHARYLEAVLGRNRQCDDIHHSWVSKERKRARAKQRVFLLPTVTFFPSLSFHNPLFPPLFSSSLPFSIALFLSFHTSLPFTPSSPSADFGLPPLPLPPRPANLFQKKRLPWRTHNKCSYFSTGQERNNTEKEKMGVGYRQAEKGEKVFIQTQSWILCCGRDLSYIRSLNSLQSLERRKMGQKEENERDRGRRTEEGETPILSETGRIGHEKWAEDKKGRESLEGGTATPLREQMNYARFWTANTFKPFSQSSSGAFDFKYWYS